MAPVYRQVDDLTSLSDLDEQIILKELKERYDESLIYTYIGDILIAVNPYRQVHLYGDQIGHDYGAIRELSELPPHIYAMATHCYQNLRRTDKNQCLLVSGESGAGKTESSKMLVAQIVRISKSSSHNNLHEKIIEVNPLLEAFGNAQTVMNNNSSRFGKLIEIMLSRSGEITGAKITEHMLEKTRVVRKNQGERTFHVFYYMFAGLSQREKRHYFLDQPPEQYRIVDPGYGNPVFVNGSDFQANESMLHDLNKIMEEVGFDPSEIQMIYGLLAGILHLCNIEFAQDPEMGHVIIMNEEAIDCAATLLSLQAEDLATVLLSNRSFVRGERIVTMKTVLQASDGRDALAKTLYSKLFTWIVQQINTILDPHAYGGDNYNQSVISVLDMAGFENFPVNSLEQLCINTANEQIQNFFNEYVFTMELKEYQGEGIKPPKIKFTNNREVLDLLLRRPVGIYAILEDECRLQTTTDLTFVDKLHQTFSKHEFYKRSKSRDPVFTVYHYAGHVTYRAEGFLDKNRDTMSPNLHSLIENSSSPLIGQLLSGVSQLADPRHRPSERERNHWDVPDWSLPTRPGYGPGDSLSRQIGRKIKQRLVQEDMRQPRGGAPVQSASGHFRNSLGDLVEKLNSAEPYFIRCLKPNASQRPMNFDPRLISNQLLSTGVLETTKIRKLGYPTRLPHHVFVERYKFVAFSLTQIVEPDYYACLHILQAASISDCEIGKTKVFLRHWQVDRLNSCLDKMIKDLVSIQNVIRMYLCRRHYLHKRLEQYQQLDMINGFGEFVSQTGDRAYHMLVSSRDHDEHRYKMELEKQRKAREERLHRNPPSRHRGLHRYDYDDDNEKRSKFSSPNPKLYNSPMPDYSPQQRSGARYYQSDSNLGRVPKGSIYQNVLNQVMQKIDDIDPDVWCKVHYMEYDRTVAKFYILDREVTIDGSYEEFDGERIGLGVFRNPGRDNRTEHIRQYIGKGLKLRKDEDGSIFATRLGSNDTIIKEHRRPADHCFSADVISCNGLLPYSEAVKVFDMEEFKSQMGLQLKFRRYDEQILEHLCNTGISFIEDQQEARETPCWLLIVNILALRNISDPNIKNQVQQKIAELAIRDEDKIVEEHRSRKAGQRHSERNWSKINLRQGLQGKEAPLRKTRLELRSKGEKIKPHMTYSWDEQNYSNKKQLNLTEIQEEYEDPESMFGGPRSPRSPRSPASVMHQPYRNGHFPFSNNPARKDWAKLKVHMKAEERVIEERDFRAKQENFS